MSKLDLYLNHYAALSDPMLAMMDHGIRVDRAKAAEKLAALSVRCRAIQAELAELIGANDCVCGHKREQHEQLVTPFLKKDGTVAKRKPKVTWPCGESHVKCMYGRMCVDFTPRVRALTGSTDLSSQRIVDYCYNHLGLPAQRQRGEESLTGNEVALRKLLLKAQHQAEHPMRRPTEKTALWKREPELAVRVLTLILEHREKAKLATYLDPSKVDRDGRMRCMYKVTTENGRLASKSNPFGTGMNLQNIPRGDMREIFVPDEGCVFLELDFSAIEDRIVKVLTQDPELIREARLRPDIFDTHAVAAKRAFAQLLNVHPDNVDVKVEVTPGNTRRQIFKPFNHGGNYGASPVRVQEMMLKDGILLPLALCTKLLDAAITAPKRAYQRETRKRIMRDRKLTNSWGRELSFEGERLDDATYRRGYAFRAASENADNLNQLGLVPAYKYIIKHRLKTRINCQVHDSLLLSCPPDEVYDVARFVIKSMETPRVYEGVELAVPVELKMGTSWKCEREWKTLPSRAEFERAAYDLLKGKPNAERAA